MSIRLVYVMNGMTHNDLQHISYKYVYMVNGIPREYRFYAEDVYVVNGDDRLSSYTYEYVYIVNDLAPDDRPSSYEYVTIFNPWNLPTPLLRKIGYLF